MNMNAGKMMAAYLEALKTDKSETTISGYSRTIRMFMEHNESGEITTSTIIAWRSSLTGKGRHVTTVSLYMQHLRSLCAFIAAMDKDFEMPNFTLIMPDRKKIAREISKEYKNLLAPKEVLILLNAERPKRCNHATWPRNKAILALLLTASMRNTELCNVRPCDLDWENGRIYLAKTKGDVPRYAKFTSIAQRAVAEYLNSNLRPSNLSDSEPLLVIRPDDNNDAYSAFERHQLSKTVETTVRCILQEHGIRSHALRHASASFMLENNVPVDVIQKRLGHANISTTMRYAQRINGGLDADGVDVFDSLAVV